MLYIEAHRNDVNQTGIPSQGAPATPVIYTTWAGDELSQFNGTRYTAKYAGMRHIAAFSAFLSLPEYSVCSMFLVRNGTGIVRTYGVAPEQYYAGAAYYPAPHPISIPLYMAIGDWFEIQVTQESGSDQDLVGKYRVTRLQIEG